ncbi:MAG: hypothetical protein M1818_001704 [Claussenomyces sp. TS43310]|nr:MAG: hypothetical protein M1818_001704 [Claussenomyces sp. TS43310]
MACKDIHQLADKDKRSQSATGAQGPRSTRWIPTSFQSLIHRAGETSSDGGRRASTSKEGPRVSQTPDSALDNVLYEVRSHDELLPEEAPHGEQRDGLPHETGHAIEIADIAQQEESGQVSTVGYKVYKRRWFGLIQLVLLNIVVSWDWLSFSPVSTTASQYFHVKPSTINWLSTAFLFAFVAISPLTIYTLHRGGPRLAIIIASLLLLVGNWIRYGGTRSNSFGAVMFGQILIGVAQPFVLSAPTKYSELWFSGNGRVAATAVMSLANPFGGALGQLIDPVWVDQPSDIPNMVLYVAIIATIASIPSFFIPAAPPTPPSHSSEIRKQRLGPSLKVLFGSPEFYMILLPYTVLVGFFNSISSLLNQILEPYSFTEDNAGIAGALLIVVGLVFAAVLSPIVDRTKKYLLTIKIMVPLVGLCYLAFIWAPPTHSLAAVYIILSVLGASSFSLVPVVLEYVIELTHPISPEITSTICWSGGQLLGGIFIIISDALTDGPNGGLGGSAPYNMQRALWFQAILALLVVPPPLALGWFGRHHEVRMRRVEADQAAARIVRSNNEGEL